MIQIYLERKKKKRVLCVFAHESAESIVQSVLFFLFALILKCRIWADDMNLFEKNHYLGATHDFSPIIQRYMIAIHWLCASLSALRKPNAIRRILTTPKIILHMYSYPPIQWRLRASSSTLNFGARACIWSPVFFLFCLFLRRCSFSLFGANGKGDKILIAISVCKLKCLLFSVLALN